MFAIVDVKNAWKEIQPLTQTQEDCALAEKKIVEFLLPSPLTAKDEKNKLREYFSNPFKGKPSSDEAMQVMVFVLFYLRQSVRLEASMWSSSKLSTLTETENLAFFISPQIIIF